MELLKFYPGLVGGYCIGVDPYYLVQSQRVEISLPDNQCGPLYKRQYKDISLRSS